MIANQEIINAINDQIGTEAEICVDLKSIQSHKNGVLPEAPALEKAWEALPRPSVPDDLTRLAVGVKK